MQTPPHENRHLFLTGGGYVRGGSLGLTEIGRVTLVLYILNERAVVLINGKPFMESVDPGDVSTVALSIDRLAGLSRPAVDVGIDVNQATDRGWTVAREWQPAEAGD